MSTSSRSTRRKEQAAFWRLAIETWQSSDMSVSQFCKAEGLPESSFYNWRKKLAGTLGRRPQGKRRQKNSQASPFVELTACRRTGVELELVLTSGNVLRIAPGMDGQTIAEVLVALRKVSLC